MLHAELIDPALIATGCGKKDIADDVLVCQGWNRAVAESKRAGLIEMNVPAKLWTNRQKYRLIGKGRDRV